MGGVMGGVYTGLHIPQIITDKGSSLDILQITLI